MSESNNFIVEFDIDYNVMDEAGRPLKRLYSRGVTQVPSQELDVATPLRAARRAVQRPLEPEAISELLRQISGISESVHRVVIAACRVSTRVGNREKDRVKYRNSFSFHETRRLVMG